MSHPASVLTGTKGERVALCDVSVSAALHDLLAEVTVKQTYRNDERVNIEAVYTFPLPLDAVLLDLAVAIGGRTLKGTVVEKQAAQERYEDAIADGNAAVMLEQLEPGLYTMNVGNLLPDETAVIAITYAVMYRWSGDDLRMLIPTTVAPRYGESPHAPHQAPESSLTVENQFSLEVEVFGSLRDARFECPSHEVALTSSPEKTTIALSREKAAMDRDFVLNVKAPQAAHSFALCGADRAGTDGPSGAAVVAAFQPTFPGLRQPRALDLAVVVDCSGSMQGDSIAQARQALAGILDGLQPRDRVTIVAFGDTTEASFAQLQACTVANLQQARQFAAELHADMGGTEIGNALQAAYAATSGSERADIFLVTDGEVSRWTDVVAAAKTSGRRIFTVGVGSSVSEPFVRELAAATGGECELVSPREGMADRVVRHFERMRAPRAKRVVAHWPEGARALTPALFGTVFEGDTVFASAQFDRSSVTGLVVLEIETELGQVFRQELAIGNMPVPQSGSGVSTVARLAAAARVKELDVDAAATTAVQYQLASPWTNWLVVAERPAGEQVFEIPAIRKVPQTMAAGWGGAGAVPIPPPPVAYSRGHDKRSFLANLAAQLPGMAARSRPAFSRAREDADELHEAAGLDKRAGRETALQLKKFLSRFDDLSKQTDRLSDDFAVVTRDARGAVDSLRGQTERRLTRAMSELAELRGRTAGLRREIETLAGTAPGSQQQSDAILELRARLDALRERLSRIEDAVMRLGRCLELLREVEDVLTR